MIYLGFSVSNPWTKSMFDTVWSVTKFPTQNKCVEFEVFKTNNIIVFSFNLTHRTHHAGLTIEIGMFHRTATFRLADNRHWDYNKGTWEAPEESA